MSTTTIRLPDALKARVAKAAEAAGTTSHNFILEAIAEKAELAERRVDSIPWDEMRRYPMERREGKDTPPPAPAGSRNSMAHVEFLPSVNEDLRRIIGHLEQHEAEHIQERLSEIVSASNMLTDNPLIGRLTRHDVRELVIGQGVHGYIGLYRYVVALDTAFALAIRTRREAGHARDA